MNTVVEEYSPFTVADFCKQRNRWQKALWLNCLNSPEFSMELKFFMWYNFFLFFMVPLGTLSAVLLFGNMISMVTLGTNFSP